MYRIKIRKYGDYYGEEVIPIVMSPFLIMHSNTISRIAKYVNLQFFLGEVAFWLSDASLFKIGTYQKESGDSNE
jgi:hypothetical protein